MTLEATPLVVGATSLDDTVGSALVAKGAVGPTGEADLALGAYTIPGGADPLLGTELDWSTGALHLVFGPGQAACAQLSAQLTHPIALVLSPALNPCILLPSTGAVPPLTQDMVHCP